MLGHIARDIVAASGAPESIQSLVLKGFREKLLLSVEIILRTETNESVGYLEVAVDWSRHQLNIQTGKNRFELDPDLNVTGQIAPTLKLAVELMQKMATDLKVARWDAAFTTRPEVATEAKRILRLGTPTAEWLAELRAARFSHELQVTDKNFNELGMTFRYSEPVD